MKINIPNKKLKSGFEMPVFGIGTWMVGGGMQRDFDNDDDADVKAIQDAIEAGITHIDTAEVYSEGHAEEIVSEAISGYDRSKLFIVSKVARENQKHDEVLRAIEASLERLKVDYLDLYLLHAPSYDAPIKETMKAMDQLVEERLVKNIGISNFTVKQSKLAQACAKNKIVANQLHLNLIYREQEINGLVDYCQENDIMFIAWRPVQKGILSKRGVKLLDEMCRKYDKTPAQIAINWLLSQENIVTLSKMRSREHLNENLGALGWKMEKDDIVKLRKDFPGQEHISNAVPLKEWDR